MALPTTPVRADLDVYGLGVTVRGDWPAVVESLRLDFAWFEREPATGGEDVEVAVERRAPDFDRFGDLPAAFVTPRNVVYQDGGRTIVDYFGRALSVLDRRAGRLEVQGLDQQLVHEAAYLFLLSRIGQHLDGLGLPRLHGLGLAAPTGAVVVMLPSGGGKSTLALSALKDERVRLLSEDTPLVDARGRAHPFPLRIGINARDADQLPDGAVRRIERMELHPKLALDLDTFRDRIAAGPAPVRHLVIGLRSLGREARLAPIPRRHAIGTLLREGVVGVGVYQGMEFVLQRGMRDTLAMGGVALARARACAAALARAKTWRLTLGRDRERNWEALAPLLR
jgi:hypothetical protein